MGPKMQQQKILFYFPITDKIEVTAIYNKSGRYREREITGSKGHGENILIPFVLVLVYVCVWLFHKKGKALF